MHTSIAFLTSNNIEEISTVIDEKQAYLNAILEQKIGGETDVLKDLYSLKRKVERIRNDANLLRESLAVGDINQSDVLAATLLQVSAYTTWASLPVDIQLAMEPLTTDDRALLPSYVDNLIEILESRLDEITIEISQQSSILVETESLSDEISQLQNEINALQGELEEQEAYRLELVSERDRAWSTYQVLQDKAAELAVSSTVENQIIKVAFNAVPPNRFAGRNVMRNTALAGIGGWTLGIALIFLKELLSENLVDANQASFQIGQPVISQIPNPDEPEPKRTKGKRESRSIRGVKKHPTQVSNKISQELSQT